MPWMGWGVAASDPESYGLMLDDAMTVYERAAEEVW